MQEALNLAREAAFLGEVPVGALMVQTSSNLLIAKAYNQSIAHHDPSAHAEILALRTAGKALQNYRLVDTTLYVTLEPCMMCVGALIHARVTRVVFGALDPKSGALGSCADLSKAPWVNHRLEVQGGVLEPECRAMLQTFFRKRR